MRRTNWSNVRAGISDGNRCWVEPRWSGIDFRNNECSLNFLRRSWNPREKETSEMHGSSDSKFRISSTRINSISRAGSYVRGSGLLNELSRSIQALYPNGCREVWFYIYELTSGHRHLGEFNAKLCNEIVRKFFKFRKRHNKFFSNYFSFDKI